MFIRIIFVNKTKLRPKRSGRVVSPTQNATEATKKLFSINKISKEKKTSRKNFIYKRKICAMACLIQL